MTEGEPTTGNPRLRRARESRCLSQADVAAAIGTTRVSVSRWERGISFPTPYFRQKLCSLYEASPRELGLVPAGGLADDPSTGPDGGAPPAHGRAGGRRADMPSSEFGDAPFDQVLLPPPDRLIGRAEELAWLVERLHRGGTIGITAVSGMGGIGKTSLAAVAVRQVYQEGRFRDGVAVVLCHDMSSDTDVLSQVIARFEAQRRQPEALDPTRLARAALRALRDKDALIVLDNVEPGLRIEAVIRPLRDAGATLLLTARHVLPRTAVPIQCSLRLDLLSTDEAQELFWHACGRDGSAATERERRAAECIVAVLDRHTLAVRLAGTYAGDVRHDLAKLAGELEADPLDVPEGETPRGVVAAFSRSIAALPEGANDLFTALGALETVECGREAVLGLARGLNISRPRAELDMLGLRALVELHVADDLPETSDRERIRLHPLLRACARERFAAWPEQRRTAALLALASYYAAYVQGDEARDVARARDRENITAALVWAHAHELHDLVVTVCAGMGPFWRDRRVKPAWLRYMPWAVAASQAISRTTDDHEQALRAADVLRVYGQMLRLLGRQAEAARVLTDTLRLHLALGDRRGEAEALLALGQLALFAGDAVEAERCLQASLAIWAAHPDMPVQDWRGHAVSHVATAQFAHRREAMEVLERYCLNALDIARRRGDRYWEGALVFALAQVALAGDRTDEARDCFQRVVAVEYELGDRRGMAAALLGLARAELADNRLDAAERRLHESLRMLQEVHDEANQAWAMSLLAQIAYRRGRMDEARTELERIAAMQEELQDPLGEGDSLFWLARLADDRGEWDEAEMSFRKSLQRSDQAVSGPDMARVNLALGRFLIERRGAHEEGCRLLREALRRYDQMGLSGAQEVREELRRLGCDA